MEDALVLLSWRATAYSIHFLFLLWPAALKLRCGMDNPPQSNICFRCISAAKRGESILRFAWFYYNHSQQSNLFSQLILPSACNGQPILSSLPDYPATLVLVQFRRLKMHRRLLEYHMTVSSVRMNDAIRRPDESAQADGRRTRTCKKRTRTNEPRRTDADGRTRRAMLFRHCSVASSASASARPSEIKHGKKMAKVWEERAAAVAKYSKCSACGCQLGNATARALDCDRLIAIVETNIDRGVPTF